MKTIRHEIPSLRLLAAICALFFALVLPASAAKTVEQIASVDCAILYTENGQVVSDYFPSLFDNDLETALSVENSQAGGYVLIDFTNKLKNNELVFVHDIVIVADGGHFKLEVSPDGTAWTTIAEDVSPTGETNTFLILDRIKQIKYTVDFRAGDSSSQTISQFHVNGYVSSVPKNVVLNKPSLAKMYNPDGTMTADNGTGGFGGGSAINWLFNGYKRLDFLYNPWGQGGTFLTGLQDNGWCLIDLSSLSSNGLFVTSIAITQCNNLPYSLYWSMDQSTWTDVEDAISVSKIGTASFDVYKTAKYIKIVLHKPGGWTLNLSEIEVFAMDPEDVFCKHPAYTEWVLDEEGSSCVGHPSQDRYCTSCGKKFRREMFWELPLGHNYVSTLDRPGKYKEFGTGRITCTRCDWCLDFPFDPLNPTNSMPKDLITNVVQGTTIGRVYELGLVNFTDVSATSTGNTDWGVKPADLLDNDWTWSWNAYWYAAYMDNQHIDYVFGTEIDLAWIDFSVHNHDQILHFYSVAGDPEEETLIGEYQINFIEDETHECGVEKIVFEPVLFSITLDESPDSEKTYYTIVTNENGGFYISTNDLSTFISDEVYYEISTNATSYLANAGENNAFYISANVQNGFDTNLTYVVQLLTADSYYVQESSGKFVVANISKGFGVSTTYYRLTDNPGEGTPGTIVDVRTEWQRHEARFYQQPIRHLRVRQTDLRESGKETMRISELHPWGTVKGAGDLRYRKETLMIFR